MDSSWRVVIHHDPRSRRRIDEQEYLVFGDGCAVEESNLVAPMPREAMQANGVVEGDEIAAVHVRAVDSTAQEEEDEAHLADMQYGDEEEDE